MGAEFPAQERWQRADSTVQGLVLEHQGVLSGGVTCGGRSSSGVAVAGWRERRASPGRQCRLVMRV